MSTEGGTLYGQWKIIYDFATNDWATIKQGVLSGTNPYQVGDTKTITLDGFGDHTVRVANISECTNGETSETACGFVVEFADIITTHNMNSTNTNVGGYPASSMYSYLKNTILPAMPKEIRDVMIDTTVISGHGPNDSSNFTTTDKLYLLSAEEIGIGPDHCNSAVSTSKQLDYYANGGEKFKSLNETSMILWTRTAHYCYDNLYYLLPFKGYTSDDYYPGIDYASKSYGISPAFRIG